MSNPSIKSLIADRRPKNRNRKVNWVKIYQLSLNTLKPVTGEYGQLTGNILRELRSFAMGGGRQTGKTLFAINELLDDDNALLISRDKDLRDDAVRRYAEAYGRGGTLKARGRILTVSDLESMKPSKLKRILAGATRVFVDDAFHNYKLTYIYNVLVQHKKTDIIVVEIR